VGRRPALRLQLPEELRHRLDRHTGGTDQPIRPPRITGLHQPTHQRNRKHSQIASQVPLVHHHRFVAPSTSPTVQRHTPSDLQLHPK
jgi:hypothetical protein